MTPSSELEERLRGLLEKASVEAGCHDALDAAFDAHEELCDTMSVWLPALLDGLSLLEKERNSAATRLHEVESSMAYRHSLIGRTEARAHAAEARCVKLEEALRGLLNAIRLRAVRGRDHVPSMRAEQEGCAVARQALRASPDNLETGHE